jgi:hypothetical protein
METTTCHRRAEIVTGKWSLFRPHRYLATLDLFLDTILDRRTEEARLVYYTKSLGNIYGNRSQIYHPKSKNYIDV